MNYAIHTLNYWGGPALALAWTMLWQSSLLIAFLFGLDFVFRRKLRASVRYALWLVVLLKLALPPSLALPTSVGWWLRPAAAAPSRPRQPPVVITYGPVLAPRPLASVSVAPAARPPARLSGAAWGLAVWAAVSLGLLAWMLVRWRQVAREAGGATSTPGGIEELLAQARRAAGLRRPVRLRLAERPIAPAVCGLIRPVLLLPRSLAEGLAPEQLRAVLLHELVHLRRRDPWLNLWQAVLQILYWWHPLLWLANARIRRAREEAVDDAVMLALEDGADTYAPTLLRVARLALCRPLASLGLVGILESRSSLGQRIERLIDFQAPRKAGLTLASVLSVMAFAALALPMGQAPAPVEKPEPAVAEPAPAPPVASASQNTASEYQRLESKTRVQDGKLLYEMGELEQADAELKKALLLDPQNQTALYYRNLVREARFSAALDGRQNAGANPKRSGRQKIASELKRIHLDVVGPWRRLPLPEVVRILRVQSLKQDTEKRGINFILKPDEAAIDPVTGLPKAGPADACNIPVTIDPPLKDASLADVLGAVVEGADKPIQYAIEDYGVVFLLKRQEAGPALYFRTFKVDPNTLEQGLRKFLGLPEGTNRDETVLRALPRFFKGIGVDLSPPKTVFYKDREGTLLVYASLEDLDTIERVIAVLATAPPQLNIQAVFIELPKTETEAFWAEACPTNQPGPGGGPAIALLTRSEAAARLRRWESMGDRNILGRMQVTTLSGRQTEVMVVGLRSIVIGNSLMSGDGVGGTSTPGTLGGTVVNQASAIQPYSETLPFGPTLDVIPYVSADGFTVQMTLIPSMAEFISYDDPGPFATTLQSISGTGPATPLVAILPLPHYRIRQVTTSVNVWDGQTVVLGDLISEDVSKIKDQVPILGDIPQKKNLLIFVTPTIIDPAGNRYHSEDEMPFAQKSFPAQPRSSATQPAQQ